MTTFNNQVLNLLHQALNNPTAIFHAGQMEAIENLVVKRARMLVVQRTGWGKSMVYFLATRLLRDQQMGPTLLVSPLLALMRNQIAAAKRIGVRAATINSTNQKDWQMIRGQLLRNTVDILLISPERLANDQFRENMLLPVADSIGLFVVDEAHCISDWGHDFRPDYRRIKRIVQALPPNIPVLATTATANDRVIADIQMQLGQNIHLLRGPLTRTSLQLQNIYLPSQAARMAWLAEQLPQLQGSGIIYTLTIRDSQLVAEWLRTCNIKAFAYHGNLKENREKLEQALLNNRLKALVATSALGMGFDKPDLGFVIHFQRPGSVVHYYQQVGRAGRALSQAYGILLSGDEDEEITNYFINTAFPPKEHTEEVLTALNQAENGLTLAMLAKQVNLRHSQIDKVLKILITETPAPVSKQGSLWFATPIDYKMDDEKIEVLKKIRHQEQQRMFEYVQTQECLMAFLARELDDPQTKPCGRCASCLQEPLISPEFSEQKTEEAVQFLKRRSMQVIEPRKQWPTSDGLVQQGWKGKNIARKLRAEPGRVLSVWGDAGWGELVKQGKQQEGHFDDALVTASAELIQRRWQPDPIPRWVTCVPSLNHPTLVADFAQRLAVMLELPFTPLVRKIRTTEPQKEMQNSYQQAHNLINAFAVDSWEGMRQPVLLVDDMVDSRWTLTIIAALLREAGSGSVLPFTLTMTTPNAE
ncbi:ATP-dependent DNA helicase RecQ [Beggiatoa sp. PS]|nr:ATP-dependent DNA helicase RecQ [Beggiatoa sp. PS]